MDIAKTSDKREQNHSGEMTWTGERMVTDLAHNLGAIEHLHRYAVAQSLVTDLDVLDIASGEGYGSALLAKRAKSVTGVDISSEAVQFAGQKYRSANLCYKVGRAEVIPLEDNSVDAVISFETLEHHEFHDEMLVEVKRVLRAKGFLMISTPDKSIYQRKDPNNEFHVKELTTNEFDELMSRHFKFIHKMDQRIIAGTFIRPRTDETPVTLDVFGGDFMEVTNRLSLETRIVNQPFFNISVASDNEIPPIISSFFDGGFAYEQLELSVRSAYEKHLRINKLSFARRLVYRALNSLQYRFFE